jgi:hypothetical protein
MAIKHMKKCSTLHVSRELKIKIRTRYHCTAFRMAKFRTLTTPNADKDIEQLEFLFIIGRNTKTVHPLWNDLTESYKSKSTLTMSQKFTVFSI